MLDAGLVLWYYNNRTKREALIVYWFANANK